jgi:hypothetical protein
VTTFVFRVRNVPAALYKALGGFATNGVNMTKLESYQLGGKFFATQFYADVEGHPDDPPLAARARGARLLLGRGEDPRRLPGRILPHFRFQPIMNAAPLPEIDITPALREAAGAVEGVALRGGAEDRRAAGQGAAIRPVACCSRPATAPRACRISAPSARWRAPAWCRTAFRVLTGDTVPTRLLVLLRRHGRAPEGPRQRAEQGDDAGPSISGLISRSPSGARPVSATMPASARTTTRGCGVSWIAFGFDYEFASATDYYRSPARFDETLLQDARATMTR